MKLLSQAVSLSGRRNMKFAYRVTLNAYKSIRTRFGSGMNRSLVMYFQGQRTDTQGKPVLIRREMQSPISEISLPNPSVAMILIEHTINSSATFMELQSRLVPGGEERDCGFLLASFSVDYFAMGLASSI